MTARADAILRFLSGHSQSNQISLSDRDGVELRNDRQILVAAETQSRATTYGLAELLDLPRDQDTEAAGRLNWPLGIRILTAG